MRRARPAPSSRRQHGQSIVEYLVVLLVAVVVLVGGDDPPIQKLAGAIREYYTDYSFAISVSSMPNCFSSYSKEIEPVGKLTADVDYCVDMQSTWPIDLTFEP